jgi:PEP-CTERM motif
MKKAFLRLMVAAACLAWLPAYAATYTYDVDYTFAVTTTNKTGSITGFITTSCDDNCILTASNVLSWSFTASDGTSDSSSNLGSGINASGNILQATPTGIYTVTNATLGGFFAFCSAIANNGSDCFSTAGLNVNDMKPDQAPAVWHIAWEEISSAEGIFSTNGQGGQIFPSIEIASAAAPEPSTWAMMLVGFAGLVFAAHRRQSNKAKTPSRLIAPVRRGKSARQARDAASTP